MADDTGLREREDTLGNMLTDLRVRLGFVSQGPASRNNEAILKSFLQDAVEYVWGKIEHFPEKKIARIRLLPEEALYDFHDDKEDIDISPNEIIKMTIADGVNRYPLLRGISEALRAERDVGIPSRWDILDGQIELYPIPESDRLTLCVEHYDNSYRFERYTDRCPVPSRLAFLCALAQAKAHYHQQDAQSVAAMFQNMLSNYRGKQVNGLHVSARHPGTRRWYVTRTADGRDIGLLE